MAALAVWVAIKMVKRSSRKATKSGHTGGRPVNGFVASLFMSAFRRAESFLPLSCGGGGQISIAKTTAMRRPLTVLPDFKLLPDLHCCQIS